MALRDLAVAGAVGVLAGTASAFFLGALDAVTAAREFRPWLTWALPLAGLALGWALERLGTGGTSVVVAALRGGPRIPAGMAPIALGGTLVTHLFGGSAGREGTAVQMGGSLADALAGRLGLGAGARRLAVVAGVAGGFGSVFGTPLAGAVFALELGGWSWMGGAVAVTGSLVGDLVARGWGARHADYPAIAWVGDVGLVWRWIVFAVAVAAVTTGFVALQGEIRRAGAGWRLPVRMAVGGAVVVALWRLAGTDAYLGLGVPQIQEAFADPGLPGEMFAWKAVFTAVTVGSGFPGGEVTPLFFVGATLGNALARGLGIPLALGAGVGMAAVFACAARAPLALAVMAGELLGVGVVPHALVVCGVGAWLMRGPGIYEGGRTP